MWTHCDFFRNKTNETNVKTERRVTDIKKERPVKVKSIKLNEKGNIKGGRE